MAVVHTGARIAAAAAITGVAWLGPQAVGVAAADSGAHGTSSDHDAAPGTPARGGNHGARTTSGPDSAVPATRAVASTRTPGSASAVPALAPVGSNSTLSSNATLDGVPVVEAAPVRRAVTPGPRSNAPVIAVVSALPAATDSPTAPVAVHSTPTVTYAFTAPAAAVVTVPAPAAAAPPASAVQAGPVAQKIGAVLTQMVSAAGNWVKTLPASPIQDFVHGALLLANRALINAGFGIGGGTGSGDGEQGAGGFGEGAVRLVIKNETDDVSFEIWEMGAIGGGAPNDQSTWQYRATLDNGETWTSTRNGDFAHQYVIKVDGEPKLKVGAFNNWFESTAAVTFEIPRPNQKWNLELGARPDRGKTNTLFYPDEGFSAWVYRGYDIDSGSFWTANTKAFEIALWDIPTATLDVWK